MTREIEFRGFDGIKWYYGDLKYNRKVDVAMIHIYEKDGSYYRQYTVDPDTIGQFTGLRDKNGKKIYEGDIVRYWWVDTMCINPDCGSFNRIYESFLKKNESVVSYKNGMFLCEDFYPLIWRGLTNLEELRNALDVSEEDGWKDCDGNTIDESVLGIEIIGNIHDNPELFK